MLSSYSARLCSRTDARRKGRSNGSVMRGNEPAKQRTNRDFQIGPAAWRDKAASGAAAARHFRNGAGNCDGNQSHEFKCKQDHDHAKPLSPTVRRKQVRFQTQLLCFQLDADAKERFSFSNRGQVSLSGHIFPVIVLTDDTANKSNGAPDNRRPKKHPRPMPCSDGSTHLRCAPSKTARRHSFFHEAVSC
jgi:hypothetical protein